LKSPGVDVNASPTFDTTNEYKQYEINFVSAAGVVNESGDKSRTNGELSVPRNEIIQNRSLTWCNPEAKFVELLDWIGCQCGMKISSSHRAWAS
jgi:hypothetical protein